LRLHHRVAAGAGRRVAGGGEAGAARGLAPRQAAGTGGAVPAPGRAQRAGAAALGHADPAAGLRRRRDRGGDGGRARGAGVLGRRDPPADRARGPRAAARDAHRAARTGGDRSAGRRARDRRRTLRHRVRRDAATVNAGVHDSRRALAAVAIALASALFFTLTYVLNRASATGGGHWAWTASLRYLITLPLLLPLMPWQGGVAPVWRAIRAHPGAWLGCSAIGFVAFYMLLSHAASSGPSWLVAGTFQFTVIAGMLLAPFIYRDARRRIPPAALGIGAVIFGGVLLLQLGHADGALDRAGWIALACLLAAAFLFPLGNRLLLLHLERTGEQLNATQRVFGMTLASQPLWLLVAAFAWQPAGASSTAQVWLAAGVALSAGVVATILFFQATGMVRDNPVALGAAEAMQGAELLFATGLGVVFLQEAWPRGIAAWGAVLVVLGIVAFARLVARRSAGSLPRTRALRTDRGA